MMVWKRWRKHKKTISSCVCYARMWSHVQFWAHGILLAQQPDLGSAWSRRSRMQSLNFNLTIGFSLLSAMACTTIWHWLVLYQAWTALYNFDKWEDSKKNHSRLNLQIPHVCCNWCNFFDAQFATKDYTISAQTLREPSCLSSNV